MQYTNFVKILTSIQNYVLKKKFLQLILKVLLFCVLVSFFSIMSSNGDYLTDSASKQDVPSSIRESEEVITNASSLTSLSFPSWLSDISGFSTNYKKTDRNSSDVVINIEEDYSHEVTLQRVPQTSTPLPSSPAGAFSSQH